MINPTSKKVSLGFKVVTVICIISLINSFFIKIPVGFVNEEPSPIKTLSIFVIAFAADRLYIPGKIQRLIILNMIVPFFLIIIGGISVNEMGRFSNDLINVNSRGVLYQMAFACSFYFLLAHDSIRMILAASVMRSRGKNNVRWILIGSGKDEKQCRDLAVKEGLYGKEVLMIPQIDKYLVPQYLSAMDITILPGSTDIICPIKVMEYMAAKSVVLVPDFACNREVINENNGLLFKPFNENSIADALCKVCDDASLREKLAENAYKTVIEHFTWDKTYGDVLKNILDKLERNYSLD